MQKVVIVSVGSLFKYEDGDEIVDYIHNKGSNPSVDFKSGEFVTIRSLNEQIASGKSYLISIDDIPIEQISNVKLDNLKNI